MKRWRVWLLAGTATVVLSGFFLAVMRPPGGQASRFGQDLPWQITRSPDGTTISVFSLTLSQSTVRDATNKLGRRYDFGLFQDKVGQLSLEIYFRDAVVGGLNARLVLLARLPDDTLQAIRSRAGTSKPSADGGRHYPVAEADQDLVLSAPIAVITFMPVAKLNPDLVRTRFGEPSERISTKDGTHWLYPQFGLDLLLGENGEALLQYVSPPDFAERLRSPLTQENRH